MVKFAEFRGKGTIRDVKKDTLIIDFGSKVILPVTGKGLKPTKEYINKNVFVDGYILINNRTYINASFLTFIE